MVNVDPSSLHAILRESLAKGFQARLTVTSNSMAPLIQAGDEIILEAVQPEQLNLGDIVTIATRQDMLTHRVWALDLSQPEQAILTRGDRPLTFDPPWPSAAVVGRVCGRARQQHVLFWREGAGYWLNQHLAGLARREVRCLTGSQEAPAWRNEPVSLTTHIKLVHRLGYAWAILITSAINVATRIKSGKDKI